MTATSYGLIPAHAGSTAHPGRRRWLFWAHPRSRGEHNGAASCRKQAEGSSPLTRGAPAGVPANHGGAGLIPAHAGSTCTWPPPHPPAGAHPRSRGEHTVRNADGTESEGSSPLTRGARPARSMPVRSLGLIPAHAGSTEKSSDYSSATRAHPRSRGEHCIDVGAAAVVGRLIPAHAGSTTPSAWSAAARRAHPRSRGEHAVLARHARVALGSSPLTRGAPRLARWYLDHARLIPAHAGSTCSISSAITSAGAHPRSRGEHP